MARPWLQLALLGALTFGLGCQSFRGDPELALPKLDRNTLTVVVAELKVHLGEDRYRFHRAVTADGRDVIAVSLWKLDRLQQLRSVPRADWQNVDLVIEFARARALERLRRYEKAGRAFARVAASGSVLAAPAQEASSVMARFVGYQEPAAEQDLERIQAQVLRWRGLSYELVKTPYQSLALEEAELWEMLRVDSHLRHQGPESAIQSCVRLIEQNRDSKLYSRHLLRLGDLYADLAGSVYLRAQTRGPGDLAEYEQLIDRALAAYELAAEDRRPGLRSEASARIEALLATHRGAVAYAR